MWDLKDDCVAAETDPLTPTFSSSVFAVAGPLEVRTVRQKHPERNQFWAISTSDDGGDEKWMKRRDDCDTKLSCTSQILRNVQPTTICEWKTTRIMSNFAQQSARQKLSITKARRVRIEREKEKTATRSNNNKDGRSVLKRDGSITADVKIGQIQCSSFIALHP